jgi:hypothetical protein
MAEYVTDMAPLKSAQKKEDGHFRGIAVFSFDRTKSNVQ